MRDEDSAALLGLIDRELLLAASPRGRRRATAWPLLELVERLSDYGADYRNFARELLLHFREILLLKLAPAGSALLAPDACPRSASACGRWPRRYSEEDLLRVFDVLTKAETTCAWPRTRA